MDKVKAKKYFGQHFLNDKNIARKVVDLLSMNTKNVVEIGPGMGALTQFLIQKDINLKVIEIDRDSIRYLKLNYPTLRERIIEGDFLKKDLENTFGEKFSLVGNFPYNISSQILFKIYDNKSVVNEMVGMFQLEVAERICSNFGTKKYGILSVLIQAFFTVKTKDAGHALNGDIVRAKLFRDGRRKRKFINSGYLSPYER